ncbi:MAG: DUF1015 domain-containing protein [Acidobacteria bacterium]|nr:MAG: DUF1015 domain-containing protein [Acidobacteriota bacterium]
MSIIRPFRAVRPVAEKAKQVSCVPYDVAHESEVRDFIQDNPESFLRVTRAEAEFNGAGSPESMHVFDRAKENLTRFLERDVFISDPEPAFYVYRLSTDEHSQTGIVGCLSIDDYENGVIKKHERTRPDKVEDRTNHMLAVRAQTGLILIAYRRTNQIEELIRDTTIGPPLYDFPCEGSIRQTVWKMTGTRELVEAFAEVPALYVADGHHRLESARLAREELRRSNPSHTGQEEYNFVLAGIFPAEELKILPYNRVVHDLNGLSPDNFLQRIQENFVIVDSDDRVPENRGDICMYLDGRWQTLRFAVDYIRAPDPVEALDVSILQNYILGPVLGISDPTTNERIEFVGGIRGVQELEVRVDSGSARVAFSLSPTTMEDLFAVSDMGEIMPPKSTWFEPKLKDGLFVHLI